MAATTIKAAARMPATAANAATTANKAATNNKVAAAMNMVGATNTGATTICDILTHIGVHAIERERLVIEGRAREGESDFSQRRVGRKVCQKCCWGGGEA